MLRPMTGVRGYRQWCICGASSVLSCMLDPTEPRTVTCTCMLGTLVPVWPSSWRRHQLEAKPEPMRAAAAVVCPVAQLARATASSSLGCILNPTVPATEPLRLRRRPAYLRPGRLRRRWRLSPTRRDITLACLQLHVGSTIGQCGPEYSCRCRKWPVVLMPVPEAARSTRAGARSGPEYSCRCLKQPGVLMPVPEAARSTNAGAGSGP